MLKNDSQKQEAIDVLLKRAASGKSYGDRKGAALGLAGLIKGLRIASLKKSVCSVIAFPSDRTESDRFGVLAALGNLMQDKRSHSKQGALFCYEALFSALGKLFEPYIPHLIPDLLLSFGDTASEVREATHEVGCIGPVAFLLPSFNAFRCQASRVMMAQVTAHGVKMMLPFILKVEFSCWMEFVSIAVADW